MIVVDFIVGVLISVLAGIGVGGGGLLVIYLTLVKGIQQIEAQGINLLFFIAAGTSSFIIHLKRRTIDKRMLILMICSGSIGAVIGSIILSYISVNIIKTIFSVFLIVSGGIELFSKSKGSGEDDSDGETENKDRGEKENKN